MSQFKLFVILFFVSICLTASLSIAGEDEHEQHGKHVHGEGELQLVLENQDLYLTFAIPAMNIVGFEHQPETEKQKEAVQSALTIFKSADRVVKISPDARCQLQSADAHFELIDEEKHHEEGEHKEENHDEGEHKEENHDEDHAGEEEHEVRRSGHAEFQIRYQFSCENSSKLEMIELLIFQEFEGIEEIEANLIVSSKQSSQELSPKNSRIRLVECKFGIGSWCFF